MDLIKQEKVGDCGPACVAMVLGCSLAEARKKLVVATDGDGFTPDRIADCLTAYGVPALESLVWPDLSVPAILTVPSLNHVGLLHFIVWDGNRFLDPTCDEKRYPDDGPMLRDERLQPQWSTAVLIFARPTEDVTDE